MKKRTQILIVPDELVLNKIYFIKGHKVMLDSDLADLYDVETRVLNQAVNRNKDRFPEDFMFQLSEEDWENIKAKNTVPSWGGRRKLPNVFTEHGILMLSSVLNSQKAIQVNIQIMRIFIRIRQMLSDNNELRLEIEQIKKSLHNHGQNLELVFQYLDELLEKKENPVPRTPIGYEIPSKALK